MITITASNGSRGIGSSVESACRDLVGHSQKMAVRVGRARWVPVEEATAAQVRHSGAIWINKDRGWHIAMLVDDVVEGVS